MFSTGNGSARNLTNTSPPANYFSYLDLNYPSRYSSMHKLSGVNDSVIFASSSACWVILFIDFDRFARCVFIFLCGVVWVLVHVCAYFGWRSSATIRALYNLSYHPKQLHLVREIGIYYCIYFFNHLQSWRVLCLNKLFVCDYLIRSCLPWHWSLFTHVQSTVDLRGD